MLDGVDDLGQYKSNQRCQKKRKDKGNIAVWISRHGADEAHRNTSPQFVGQRWFELQYEQPGGDWVWMFGGKGPRRGWV